MTSFLSLNGFAKSEIIICGDLNLIFDNKMDKKEGPPHANVRCRETVTDNMTQLALKDNFRFKNPILKKNTRFNIGHLLLLQSTIV